MSAKELFHNIPLHIPCLLAEVHSCLHHGIGTAAGAAHFRLDKLSRQGEDHIEDGLVMTLGIVAQFVGNAGKALHGSSSSIMERYARRRVILSFFLRKGVLHYSLQGHVPHPPPPPSTHTHRVPPARFPDTKEPDALRKNSGQKRRPHCFIC